MKGLTQSEKERYTRQLILEGVGVEGQLRLKASKVLVVGTGGLGSPILYYLTASGVGQIGLADCDTVDLSNLQRQVLHSTEDLGRLKTDSAGEKLIKLNPDIHIQRIPEKVTRENAKTVIRGYDVVVDGTDNFVTRFILNETCIAMGIPFIHGGVRGFFGQVMTILPRVGPCLQCLFPTIPDMPTTPPGVIGAVAGTIGTIQATETLKILLHQGNLLVGRLMVYDALNVSLREVPVAKNQSCPICGEV